MGLFCCYLGHLRQTNRHATFNKTICDGPLITAIEVKSMEQSKPITSSRNPRHSMPPEISSPHSQKLVHTFRPTFFKIHYNSGLLAAVGIASGYGLDDRGVAVRVPVASRIFSSPRRPDLLWGSIQPPIQWVPGALSPGVKRQGREADHSLPTSAQIKKIWIYTSSPPYTFMA
jgi:hypothetical protein